VIKVEEISAQFFFNRYLRVATPGEARLRGHCTTTWGLRDVSFSIGPGEGTALIGASGSGKTTLLRLLAGVYEPDTGRIEIRGRVATLLSIDAGLLGMLTGRENALLLGVLAGLTRSRILGAMEEIKIRSGLEEAFERPVLTYSQGMRARLGLAVAEEVDPQILLLDEVHEALDHEFRSFLEGRAHEILARGGVVVAAGHDHPMLSRLCTRAIWLEEGRVRDNGDFAQVQSRYLAAVEVGGSPNADSDASE
jgi:ABC-type polysaccharide/polyol phosphate transport system ATPase subunit